MNVLPGGLLQEALVLFVRAIPEADDGGEGRPLEDGDVVLDL